MIIDQLYRLSEIDLSSPVVIPLSLSGTNVGPGPAVFATTNIDASRVFLMMGFTVVCTPSAGLAAVHASLGIAPNGSGGVGFVNLFSRQSDLQVVDQEYSAGQTCHVVIPPGSVLVGEGLFTGAGAHTVSFVAFGYGMPRGSFPTL